MTDSADPGLGTGDFDFQIKHAVYRHFVSTALAPTATSLAEDAGVPTVKVHQAFARLRASRLLFLEDDGISIRMAPPFSAVRTQHRVLLGERQYYANCAWDALGVVAALQRPGLVLSECAQSGETLRLEVGVDGPPQSDWVFHCLVPAAKWWDDLVFT